MASKFNEFLVITHDVLFGGAAMAAAASGSPSGSIRSTSEPATLGVALFLGLPTEVEPPATRGLMIKHKQNRETDVSKFKLFSFTWLISSWWGTAC